MCLVWNRHLDVDLRLPFGLQSSPTRPIPWQKGYSLSRTKGNCDGVTAPGFTPEHPNPNLLSRTCIFHLVTAHIRTFPFYRHSGLSVLTPSLSLSPFLALPFASRVTIATGSRTPFTRHERIWGRFLGKEGGGEKKIAPTATKKERGEEAPMPRTVRGLPQTSSPASSAEKREGGVVVFIAERGKKALLDVGYNFLGTK